MRTGTFLRTRFEHIANARRTRSEIEALQLKKFRRLVAFAQQRSPYYRDLISALKIDIESCRPSDFPPLTKAEMMENFDRIVTDRRISRSAIDSFMAESDDAGDLFLNEYLVIHSSGTSGTIGYSVFGPADWAKGAALGMRVWPVTLRRRRMAFFGVIGGHYGGASHMARTSRGVARLRFVTKAIDIGDPIEQTVAALNQFMPDTLSGYPSTLLTLADAQLAGDLRIAPQFIASGGEALTAHDRDIFNEAFGATLLNVYGTSEHLTMGVGRPEDDGIYLFEDELIFEIEPDRVLITNLFNCTQPLIRYVMDDRLEQADDPNPRLPFTKIKDVASRANASPVFTNRDGVDEILSADDLVTYLEPVSNVTRIQFHMIDKSSCVLKVKLKGGINEDDRRKALHEEQVVLDRIFETRDLGHVRRSVEEVDGFDPGKAKLVVVPDEAADR